MTGMEDRRGAYRQGSLRHAGSTLPRPPGKVRVHSTRVSKRSSTTSTTTTSTLSRLALSIASPPQAPHPKSQSLESTEQPANEAAAAAAAAAATAPATMSAAAAPPLSQAHPQPSTTSPPTSPTTSSPSSSSIPDSSSSSERTRPRPRPLSARHASGTNIVARDDPHIELQAGDETFAPDDARAMSPRRTSEDLEKMSQDARIQLSQHAKILHESLLEIFNRIDAVRQEHDKLDSNNKFLQKYIGDLMSTSKITATGASGRKK